LSNPLGGRAWFQKGLGKDHAAGLAQFCNVLTTVSGIAVSGIVVSGVAVSGVAVSGIAGRCRSSRS
jgi:hypothetical protein